MKKAILLLACVALLSYPPPASAESLWKKLLRVTGISATPSQQKAPDDEMEAGGEIWIAQVTRGTSRKLSDASGFRSPIFAPNDRAVLALKEGTLWQLSLETGAARKLRPSPGLTKLIGIDRDDSDKILVLMEHGPTGGLAFFSLADGAITGISYDANSSDDRKLLRHLKEWERVYGETKVYPQAQTRDGVAGTVEWQDVFLKRDDAAPVNVSRCDGANCGQPSLSSDGEKVVFIRAKQ